MNTTEKEISGPKPAIPQVWTFTTYFCEGLPYAIIRSVSTVFFRDNGVSLEGIGLTSLFGLPWALKFFWAPHLDRYSTKRRWLLGMQILLAGLMLVAATLANLPHAASLIGTTFFVGSFLAATHDIAIDGYYLETLDPPGQARFVGYRVMAYRIAMMTGTGIIATVGTTMGWPVAFGSSALLLTFFYAYHLRYLPISETAHLSMNILPSRYKINRVFKATIVIALAILFLRQLGQTITQEDLPGQDLLFNPNLPTLISVFLVSTLIVIGFQRKKLKKWLRHNNKSFISEAFVSYVDREKIIPILAFILLIRTGEYMLSSMVAPFMVDLGIKKHYGWISGAIGLPFSIFGAMLGGWLISKYSFKRMIWPFLFAQNFTNLAYMFLALKLNAFILLNTGNTAPIPIGAKNLLAVVCVHAFDQFAGGLGTAVLMIFLMRLCQPKFKAAHYAIGTGLMSFSGLYAGVSSGFLAAWVGYGYFFGISFLLSLPGMALVFFIPMSNLQRKEALG